jgi:hypothetical protein
MALVEQQVVKRTIVLVSTDKTMKVIPLSLPSIQSLVKATIPITMLKRSSILHHLHTKVKDYPKLQKLLQKSKKAN